MVNANSEKKATQPKDQKKKVKKSTQLTLQERLLNYDDNPNITSSEKEKLLEDILRSGKYVSLEKEDIKVRQALETLFTNEFNILCYSKFSREQSEPLQPFIKKYLKNPKKRPKQVHLLLRICLTYIEAIQLIDIVKVCLEYDNFGILKHLSGEFQRLVEPTSIETCLRNIDKNSSIYNGLKSLLKKTRANLWATIVKDADQQEQKKAAQKLLQLDSKQDQYEQLQKIADELDVSYVKVVDVYQKFAQDLELLKGAKVFWAYIEAPDAKEELKSAYLKRLFPANEDLLQTLRNLATEVERTFEGVVQFYMKHAQTLRPLTPEEVQVLLNQDFADKASILKVLNTTMLTDESCDLLLEKVLQDEEQLAATLFEKLASNNIDETWKRFPKARLNPCFEEQFSVHYKSLNRPYSEILRVMEWDDEKKQNFIQQQVEEKTFNKQDWDDCELERYIVNWLSLNQEPVELKLKKLVNQGLCLSLYEALSIYARNYEVTEELIAYILNSFLREKLEQEELVKLFVDAKWLEDEAVREMLFQYVSEDYTEELGDLIDDLAMKIAKEEQGKFYADLSTVFANKTKELKEELRKKIEDDQNQANLDKVRKHLISFTEKFESGIAHDLYTREAEERWLTLYKDYRKVLQRLGYKKENMSLGDVLTVEQMEQYDLLNESKDIPFDAETMEVIVASIGMRLPQETNLKSDFAPKALIVNRSEGK